MQPRVDLHVDHARADSFGAAARLYDARRPRYPDQLIDDLLSRGAQRVLDVGAGTGIASEQLLGKGVNVLAVEPDLRMAKIAKERGIVIEIGRLIASIRAAGFTVEQRTYPRRAHYSLEQGLSSYSPIQTT